MLEQIARYKQEVEDFALPDAEALEQYRQRYLSRKGAIPQLFEALKTASAEQKAALGKALNELKQLAQHKLEAGQQLLTQQLPTVPVPEDLTRPGLPSPLGGRHPLRRVERRIVEIFAHIGFEEVDGPEIEDDWHNFTALNFPPNHPARDMQDTFFIARGPDVLLRTHTSSVQVRAMQSRKPPMRLLMPGRVYRNEAISARAHCFFHQVEGLAIGEDLSLADLKQTLLYFCRNLLGPQVQTRLRASYFPFTEVSAEMDVTCRVCNGTGCTICKHTGWVEILGCGMVDPQVLINCGIDADQYSGYAFGMGVERITQMLYRVADLRLYSQNDLRFLRQLGRLA